MVLAPDLIATKASLPRRVWGSVLATIPGWLALNLVARSPVA